MKAMIFAAGMGSRLKPLTDTMPKALVPVGGKPLLQHVVEKLVSAGFDSIVVNVHHFAQQIIDFLDANNNFGVDIAVSNESELLLDTGGGIKKASHFFDDGKPFLVHNVDILSNVDLKTFYDSHLRSNADISLLASWRETQRYLLFDGDGRLKGWTNIQTGQIKSPYSDIDVNTCQKLAFSGIHVISPSALSAMKSYPDVFPIMDFYLKEADKLTIMAYQQPDLKMVDVGKLYALDEAEKLLKTLQD